MKILLLQHARLNNQHYPLGLGYIAAVLGQAGHDVDFVDLAIDDCGARGVSERLKRTGTRAVGLSAMTPNYRECADLVRKLRRDLPDLLFVLGGPHAAVRPEEVLRNGTADVAVCSEGEVIAPMLFDVMEKGGDLSDLPGIAFLNEKGRCVRTPPPPLVENLDGLPLPPWELLQPGRYRGRNRGRPVAGVLTSRGCPYRCVFCNRGPAGQKRFRQRSPAGIVQELDRLKHGHGIGGFVFRDDLFTFREDHTRELSERIVSGGLKVPWQCQTRVDRVTVDLLRSMRRAGCTLVSFGVESGSEYILEKMRKGIMKEQVERAFACCREAGMPSAAYFIIGTPWETPATIEETISFARELPSTSSAFFLATPYPGTELEAEFRRAGWPVPGDLDDYVHSRAPLSGGKPLPEDSRDRRGYFLSQCRRATREVLLARAQDPRCYPRLLRAYVRRGGVGDFLRRSVRVSWRLLTLPASPR